ncbi:MAG TPA: redoxin family protein [Saprospiraceae bacterium]|nr:redoxin family protein [Saprospiraceae bacterium]HND88547.1 redoxin family protein [Saprospiraceae bacterium]
MRLHSLLAACLLLSACHSVRLSDDRAQNFDFQRYTAEQDLVAVVFLAPDCPICQKQVLTLNRLAERFPQVRFAGVFTKWDSWADVARFQQKYHPQFPLWRDGRMRLVKHLDASITPQVFLLKRGAVVYRGAVDNWFVSLGRYRPEPTEHYVQDAIEQILAGSQVGRPITEAVGCWIER